MNIMVPESLFRRSLSHLSGKIKQLHQYISHHVFLLMPEKDLIWGRQMLN